MKQNYNIHILFTFHGFARFSCVQNRCFFTVILRKRKLTCKVALCMTPPLLYNMLTNSKEGDVIKEGPFFSSPRVFVSYGYIQRWPLTFFMDGAEHGRS